MKPDWNRIDTVLLDMDGTLLDLHFDNFFWLQHVPRRYAEHHGICPDRASTLVAEHANKLRGTLNWYCTDYWSKALGINIAVMKKEIDYLISERPQALEFLRKLGRMGKQRVLITNAHHHSLQLKLSVTQIGEHLDTIISAHSYGKPKESQNFWHQLNQQIDFDPARTLFIDDSEAILRSAQRYGISHLMGIHRPDSKKPSVTLEGFEVIEHFSDLTGVN